MDSRAKDLVVPGVCQRGDALLHSYVLASDDEFRRDDTGQILGLWKVYAVPYSGSVALIDLRGLVQPRQKWTSSFSTAPH